MAGLGELKDALRETLEARGSLQQVKARIRAEIYNALDDDVQPRPQLSNENLVINELVREYLAYNDYKHTLSVLIPETGQPADPLDQGFLAQDLGVTNASPAVPLLYTIVNNLFASANREGGHAVGGGSSGLMPPPVMPAAMPMREPAYKDHAAQAFAAHALSGQVGVGGMAGGNAAGDIGKGSKEAEAAEPQPFSFSNP
jgi:lisH domain-containing protein FOPNL